MEMLNKFLKDSVALVAGRPSENIVDYLNSKKYVNEWLIAKKLDLTINQVRNILYKLSDNGLVSSIRKKDKRKGWYTYFWKIESVKALEFLKKNLEKRMSQVSNQIDSREVKTFYICETCNIEHNEENALLHDFICNECGSVFTIKDNTKLLKELKKNFEKQKKEIVEIDLELSKEREVLEKVKAKEIKKASKTSKKSKVKKKAAKKKTPKPSKKPAKKAQKKTSKKSKVKKKAAKKKTSKKATKKKIKNKKVAKKITKKKKARKK